MKIYTEILKLKTNSNFEFINITEKVRDIIKRSNIREGTVNVFSKHTTLALEINEDEKLLLKDIELFLEKLVPDNREYFHDKIELREGCPLDEPKNAKGHLRSLLMETSQTIPLINDKICLGKWQQIFAIETSNPRDREIIVQVMGII